VAGWEKPVCGEEDASVYYQNRGWTPKLFLVGNIALMVLLSLAILYPIYYMAIISLSDGAAVLTGQVKLYPIGITLRAYQASLQDPLFRNSYKNTAIITLLGTIINIVMTILCAYPLSRRDFNGRRVLMALATFTMFFSGGMIPSYLLVTALRLNNTYWALVLPGAISVYNMIVMRTFFQGIPFEITESAYIDGANDVTVLFRLILPLSTPIILTMVLFYSVGHWNGFYNALLYLTEKKMYPIQLFVRSVVLAGETLSIDMANKASESGGGLLAEQSTKYAIIIISILPILAVFPIISRYFKTGVMIGSIKG
jgi:putative aldouronate transport system permease protein